jgi:oligopeptide/dipeptide ABC transporter ATP-binding protein
MSQTPTSSTTTPLLSVRDLAIEFTTDDGCFPAVRGVSFDLEAGKCMGLVGESGSGKSVTAMALLGLIPQPPGRVTSGSVMFDGRDLIKLPPQELRALRGGDIAMIFQEPMSSLNPAFTIGDQIAEAIRAHQDLSPRAALDRAIELLREVRMPAPERRVHEYPHKLSGGMRQRVMIAMALACRPRLLIADEPTTALDVTIQAQILKLLRDLQQSHGMSILIISHNLGAISEVADDVAVMYAGRIVENAPAEQLFLRPEHPYTIGLLGAIPRGSRGAGRLVAIDGMVPDLRSLPPGCTFRPRCPFAFGRCDAEDPGLKNVGPQHLSACHGAPLEAAA